jgi:hypothetical protein
MRSDAKITAGAVRVAVTGAQTRCEVLKIIGVSTTSQTYARLETVAYKHGIPLPAKANRGRPGPRAEARTSPMWDRGALEQAVNGALSITEILHRLGLTESARRQLLRAADALGVSLPDGRVLMAQERRRAQALKLLVKGSTRIKGERLTRYIMCAGLYPYVCAECGLLPEWNSKPLVLQVDHINGDPTDNRPENLRFLCPNCHTQTETFASRNCGRLMGNGETPATRLTLDQETPGSSPGSPALMSVA